MESDRSPINTVQLVSHCSPAYLSWFKIAQSMSTAACSGGTDPANRQLTQCVGMQPVCCATLDGGADWMTPSLLLLLASSLEKPSNRPSSFSSSSRPEWDLWCRAVPVCHQKKNTST